MMTSPSLGPAKIGQLRDEFLRSDAGKDISADEASRLRKFVTWCGFSTSAEAVQPYKIEEFLAGQVNTSVPPRSYTPVLKAFFGWAHKQGLLSSDPMKTVRLPRGAGTTKKVATPKSVAATERAAAQREEDTVYVSRDHHQLMQSELERMRTDERNKISHMLHEAIKDGDLSENAAYDDAKLQQGLLEARIREVEAKLRNVQIIEDQDVSRTGIGVGSRVVLEETNSGDEIEYLVVGPEETNPRGGKISHRSPVGRAILGKSAGDEVEVSTPGGAIRYRVVSVS
ncbi:MAG TPA: transcription elongation factor GreA [Chloroflexota bacterium]|nr:transcription elongation factor GreA [Chloroflexota bacterium]